MKPDWIIDSENLRQELKGSAITLVDVREPEEFEESRIDGGILLPLGSLSAQALEALPNRDATIVVYCAHGVRSLYGVQILRSLGYANTRSLEGGICAWEEPNGEPVAAE